MLDAAPSGLATCSVLLNRTRAGERRPGEGLNRGQRSPAAHPRKAKRRTRTARFVFGGAGGAEELTLRIQLEGLSHVSRGPGDLALGIQSYRTSGTVFCVRHSDVGALVGSSRTEPEVQYDWIAREGWFLGCFLGVELNKFFHVQFALA